MLESSHKTNATSALLRTVSDRTGQFWTVGTCMCVSKRKQTKEGALHSPFFVNNKSTVTQDSLASSSSAPMGKSQKAPFALDTKNEWRFPKCHGMHQPTVGYYEDFIRFRNITSDIPSHLKVLCRSHSWQIGTARNIVVFPGRFASSQAHTCVIKSQPTQCARKVLNITASACTSSLGFRDTINYMNLLE